MSTSRALRSFVRLSAALLAFGVAVPTQQPTQEPAQQPAAQQPDPQDGAQPERPGPVPTVLLDGCDWRLVGPFRGGRVAAVTGVPRDRDTYWFGACGGGVWKTTDAGKTWSNVSDGYFGGSIGAVAVAPSDPDTVYVGGGEKTWRGNVSSGDGMWKSTDAGKTWTFLGLPDSRHVSRIRIDPKDKDRVFAAVMGHVSGPSEERGVYRSLDGGQSWTRVLFANSDAGAVDLCFEPGDPQVLYASTWRARRLPHRFDSGGDGSGLWKSTDGGDTWQDLSQNRGMPKGPLGIVGVTVSPADPQRVWAQIEAPEGGLFRSDDRGATWKRVNDDRDLRQRAWYYTRCYADPKDKDTVYVLNVGFHKSTDGGATFTRIRTPHGDNHDLWIDPADPRRMIEGNDGGANVTTDGGSTWSTQQNQPTAQFYRVTTDTARPYRIYGAQQDNSTVRIDHRGRGAGIDAEEWEPTAGGESGWLAPKPDDPEVVFGGSYGGYLERRDHRTGLSQRVDVWPDNPMGAGAEAMRFRFQWNFPILWSPHDPDLLYTAGNVLFQSRDLGHSWQPISGDLTRNDPARLVSSGGPITQDNTGVEYYGTIFTVAESPLQQGVIWCGSDDGLVHVTRDGGQSWANVTPPDLPEWAQVNCIEADPFTAGGCYLAATRYKLDDFKPYVYVTHDFGQTWREAVRGIDPGWFTRCVRADPEQQGLLYCSTERTVWVSFDDGWRWQRLQQNLPLVPVTDLCVKDGALIAATQGRSFWSFDHLHHLRQLAAAQAQQDVVLYEPAPWAPYPGTDDAVSGEGQNPAAAPVVRFFVGGEAEAPVAETCRVEVLGEGDAVLWSAASDAAAESDEAAPAGDDDGDEEGEGDADAAAGTAAEDDAKPAPLDLRRGMNTVRWTWKTEDAKGFDGMILWAGGLGGPRQPAPGEYRVRLTFGDRVQEQALVVLPDLRATASAADLRAQHEFVAACRDTITKAHEAIVEIRSLREQIDAVVARAGNDEQKGELRASADALKAALTAVEEALYQTKSKSRQDPLNYPIQLTDKLAGVMSAANRALFAPTTAQVAVRDELTAAIDQELAGYAAIRAQQLAEFNALALRLAVPHVR
ncbi:MAG: WD40/YVTN/BNR-like repeat-containing protein [Planctomycetota bacterium]